MKQQPNNNDNSNRNSNKQFSSIKQICDRIDKTIFKQITIILI